MNRRLMAFAVVLGLVVFGGSLAVRAQGPAKEIYTKISFPFLVGDNTFMPGDYQISRVEGASPALKVSTWDGKTSVEVPVITRLARHDHTGHDTTDNLVFDRVGDQHFLSEVWMQGEDGYLVRGTAENHGHKIVPAKHKQ